jgi:hypothetical protein
MRVHDELVVLQGVPQGACNDCGSRVYKADILLLIESLMRGTTAGRTPNRISS